MNDYYVYLMIGVFLGVFFITLFQLVEFIAYKYPQYWFGKKAFIHRMRKLKKMREECQNELNNED